MHSPLAEMIAADHTDPGATALLTAYTARRRADREQTLMFSKGLAQLTSNGLPLLRPLRSLGLLAVSHIGGLQALLVNGAMGFRGDVPQLCRNSV